MAGRPWILAETTWAEVSTTDYDVAVLPWGATEAHNYHLPYNTDVVQCDHIAAESARIAWETGARVIVLPTVPFGVNTGQVDIKLDINMNPSTQLSVLEDVVDGLDHHGIEKLVVMNGHGANDFKQIIRELWPRTDVFLCTLNWYQWIDASVFDDPGDHAGEMETSLMQHLAPDLVKPLTEAGDGAEKRFRIAALNDGRAWTQRDWTEATADTGVGDPAPSTPAKGKACFDHVCAGIGQFLAELASTPVDELYE